MRYVRIFLLHFQNTFEHRSRMLVWFLESLFNPFIALLFWRWVYAEGSTVLDWSLSNINSYYLLLVIVGAVLMAHIEYDVAYFDIQYGDLVRYLTRPLPYYLFKLFDELPWRLIQGIFATIIFFGLLVVLNQNLILISPTNLVVSIAIALLAFLLSFTFKMIVGLMAFWITDIGGLQQLIEIGLLIFAGYIIPLEFFPSHLQILASNSPFAYMVYFPILAFQGRLDEAALLRVIGTQFFWVILFILFYLFLWRKGLRTFTGVGR